MSPDRLGRELRNTAALIEAQERADAAAAAAKERSRQRLARHAARRAEEEWLEASSHPSYWSNY